jgi:hypothetical protein
LLFLSLLGNMYYFTLAGAEELALFSGRITDIQGKPLKGAAVFLYTGTRVRKQADYISAETGEDGKFRMAVPPGSFRAVARLKKEDGFGPLMPGDKHSGDAAEVELAAGAEFSRDFVLADIREAARMVKKTRIDILKVQGRIVDGQGKPVPRAYAAVWKTKDASGFPDYLSAWTGDQGMYTLYLPPGRYYVSAMDRFPPDKTGVVKEYPVKKDVTGLDIVMAGARTE